MRAEEDRLRRLCFVLHFLFGSRPFPHRTKAADTWFALSFFNELDDLLNTFGLKNYTHFNKQEPRNLPSYKNSWGLCAEKENHYRRDGVRATICFDCLCVASLWCSLALAFCFCMSVWQVCFYFVPAKQVLTKSQSYSNIWSKHVSVFLQRYCVASSGFVLPFLSLQNSFLQENLQGHKEKGIYKLLKIC